MAQLSKMTKGQLQDVRDATAEKLAVVEARKPGGNSEVNKAFAGLVAELKSKLAGIDAEIAGRK